MAHARMISVSLVVLLFAGQSSARPAAAEDWPCWRGPRADGTSLEANIPVRWNGETGENIAWKAPVPGEGHASPIVSGDSIFLLSCLVDSGERVLQCLDRGDGSIRWQKTVVTCPLETRHAQNSHASSTPATDGETVYVTFLEIDGSTIPAPNVGKERPVTPGKMVVAAYDFAGNRKWLVRPGEFVSAHGFCSSPVLFEGLVIVNGDHDGDSYVVALDKQNGETVWKVPRRHKTRSYVTPLIRRIGERTQMVLSGSKCIVSLDPRNGDEHWRLEGPTEQFVASMVYDGRRMFMAAGFPTYHVMAIDPEVEPGTTKPRVAWHVKNAACYVPSPVLADGYLLVADDRGTANCFDAVTGERLWQGRLGKHFHASLVTAGGLVYFVADDGLTRVVKPGPKLEIVAENPLGEYSFASPAISNGQLFLRGERHLYCVGARE